MNEEINDMKQIIDLYGRGVPYLGKGILLTGRGIKKGADLARLAIMQLRMKLHYASTGTRDTMTVKSLEKLTGGQYDILNIPFEDEKNLKDFYDHLKKLKVSFAELPDLCLGDGFTQIAYNPQDATKVKIVADYFKEKLEVEAAVISLEQYEKMGGDTGKRVLAELATKGYEKEQHMQHLQHIRDRNNSPDYLPISLNMETLFMQENRDCYYCRVPGTMKADKTALVMRIKKEDALILDKGQTIYTHLKKDEDVTVFLRTSAGGIDFDTTQTVSYGEIAKKFNRIKDDRRKETNRIGLNQPDKLPNFNQGEPEQIPVSPKEIESEEHTHGEEKRKITSKSQRSGLQSQEIAPSISRREKRQQEIKEMLAKSTFMSEAHDREYLPAHISLSGNLIAEEPGEYLVKIPGTFDDEKKSFLCLPVSKKNSLILGNGTQLFFHIRDNSMVSIREYQHTGGHFEKKELPVKEILRLLSKPHNAGERALTPVKQIVEKTEKVLER